MADCRPRVLIVDDDPDILAVVEQFAHHEGCDTIMRAGGQLLLRELPTLKVDAAVVDLRMPEVDGLHVLRAIREVHPECQVILMTAYGTIDSAIEAVKFGAIDYLSKPLDFDRLANVLRGVRFNIVRRERLMSADCELGSRFEFFGLIGRSPAMQELFDMVRRLAPHARTALITGETGTGKELVARALHRLGPRRDRKFIPYNCGAIVETLCETELFGHARGAFTGAVDAKPGLFEAADGGTVFLDEIGELPLAVQAKLLRVLEYGDVQRVGSVDSRKVDVRVVAATNRGLADEVAAGRFRQDLYYRLNVVEIALPPLRDRPEDIPYLTAAFLKEFAARFGKPLVGISHGAERLLNHAHWPGNVRELRNVIERACMLGDGPILSEREALVALGGLARSGPRMDEPTPDVAAPIDRHQLELALQQLGGNRTATARKLGISRRALYRRLDSLGLR